MKVNAIFLNGIRNSVQINRHKHSNDGNSSAISSDRMVRDLYGMPYIYPITFTSIQNSSKLRILFAYNLPCIYTGVPMIDPKRVVQMIKNSTFDRPSGDVVKILEPYKKSIGGMEAKILNIIEQRAKIHPQKTVIELIREIEPYYRKDLRKTQTSIFEELNEYSKELSPELQQKYNILMRETNKKLTNKPVIVPFSSYEFKYRLVKIRDGLLTSKDVKTKRVLNKLIKESKRLKNETNDKTREEQIKVIGMLDWILRKSILKDNVELRSLIMESKQRLKNEEILVPFSRKNFIYDLGKIVDEQNNPELRDKIMSTAVKLPTSTKNVSAFIVKASGESSQKTIARLLWPYTASVEHILPRSCGGENVMSNYAGATNRANSTRKSIDLTEQIKLHPNTPKYCQMYVDRLIELYHQGIFEKHRIDPKYIRDFKNTIYEQSKHLIDLDISAM